MIPRPGDIINYSGGARFMVVRVEDAIGQHAGKLKLFAHRLDDGGRPERDFEAWFIYPMSDGFLISITHQHHEQQLDLFGDAA